MSAKFSFTEEHHSTTFVCQSTPMRTSHNIVDSFLVLKIMLIYAKILQSTTISRSFPSLNLKTCAWLPAKTYVKFADKISADVDIAIATYDPSFGVILLGNNKNKVMNPYLFR